MSSESTPPAESPGTGAAASRWKEAALALANLLASEVPYVSGPQHHDFQERMMAGRGELDAADEHLALERVTALALELREYCGQTQRDIDQMVEELRTVASLLLGYVSAQKEADDSVLLDLQRQLLEAEDPAAIMAARQKLTQTLESLHAENQQRTKQAQDLTDTLQARLHILEQLTHSPAQPPQDRGSSTIDGATGLPLKPDAVSVLRAACNGERPMFAVVFYVERMALTNGRFGHAIGDQVLMLCSQHIATRLIRPHDALFRWAGPSFLAILERGDSVVSVSNEVQRFLGTPLSQYFELPFRTVYLPIKMVGETMALRQSTYAEAVDKIDKFVTHATETSL